MGTRFKIYFSIFTILANCIQINHGCQMDGVTNWIIVQVATILDTHRGEVFSRGISNILGINEVTYSEGLHNGPYMDIYIEGSTFFIATNDNFHSYEEYETLSSININVQFNCVDGSQRLMSFTVNVDDTNNNDPTFLPSDVIELQVTPPMPPGFEITLNEILVRDIDLTTQRIDFEVVDTEDFDISYNEEESNEAKEFRASLKSLILIRNIPEPIEFRIKATDVDLTDDLPRTTYATVRIVTSGQFELPDELIFSRAYYTATYTEYNQISLQQSITLLGYREEVSYDLEGTYANHFSYSTSVNEVFLSVTTPLPSEVLSQRQIMIELIAELEYTSGATAAIIVELPEVVFGRSNYRGTIIFNDIEHESITLERFTGDQVEIIGEYSSEFNARHLNGDVRVELNGNLDLPDDVQSFVLELRAGTASAVLIFSIIGPAFGRNHYEGTILSGNVAHDPISLTGFEGAGVELSGAFSTSFNAIHSNEVVLVQPTGILNLPFNIQSVVLELSAGNAKAVLTLDILGAAFAKNLYEGTIRSGEVEHETITIERFEGTEVELVGAFSTSFNAIHANGVVLVQPSGTLNLPSDIQSVVLELSAGNAKAVLTLAVSGAAFAKNLYEGEIRSGQVEHEAITVENFEGSEVELRGAYNEQFIATHFEGTVNVEPIGTLNLPAGVQAVALELRNAGAEAVLILNVIEAAFAKNLYEGTIRSGEVEHEAITIERFEGTEVELVGAHNEQFIATHFEGTVKVAPIGILNLPPGIQTVALEFRGAGAEAVLILNVLAADTVPPLAFGRTNYEGYIQEGIVHHETITIPEYEGTQVDIGDTLYSVLFTASSSGGEVQVVPVGTLALPADVTFVTLELRVDSAVSILILDVRSPGTVPPLAFGKTSYEGYIQEGIVHHETITIPGYEGTQVDIGDTLYSVLFTASSSGGEVQVVPVGTLALPADVTFVTLELRVGSAVSILILDVRSPGTVPPLAFGKTSYEGYIQEGIVHHETITIPGYEGTQVDIGDTLYSVLFTASSSGGEVQVVPVGTLALPADVTFVTLELRVGSAVSILILDVRSPGTVPPLAFGKTSYEGYIQEGIVHHETITIPGYEGTQVDIGDTLYSVLFTASSSGGEVQVVPVGTLALPADVTFVTLELRVGSAVSILILDVRSPGTVPPLAFGKTSYEGYIQEGIVHHETITIPGYEGTQVDIGDTLYSVLFTASSSGGEVQVVPVGTLALPADVTFVTLELRVGSAVSILILDVRSPGTVPPLAFGKTSYEGYIQEGIVHHETITIPGYEGTQVDIGDTLYSVLFTASSSGGEVQVVPVGTLALPADVTFVTLELRVGSAVSILILDVRSPGTVPPLAFDKTSYEGYIQEGIVHHETITIPGYEGTQVDIGDTLYSVLFTASSSGGEVQVVPVGTLALPADVTFVTLELRVGSAVSILILDVRSPGTVPPLAFDKTSYEGYIQEGIVHHETITIPGYEGTQVDIGDTLYSVLFTASSSGGEVQVVPVGTLALPADVTFVTLELRVGSAVSILILDVRSPGTVPPLAFGKTSYEGYIQEGIVHHETITIPGYEGTQVDIGDTLYSVLFTASSSGGEVQVVPVGTLALPADVTFVTLELRVGSAVSILILDVRSPGTVPPLAFGKTSYEGYIQEGIVHHETITIPGYEGTQVDIGDTLYSVLFTASSSGGEVQVVPVGTLALPADVTFVTLELRVGSAVSILILDVRSPGTVPPLAFGKTSYEGYIQEGIVHHETITIPGYEGTQVDIGDTLYSVLFTASSSGGEVQVVPVGTLALPADVTFVTLELRVGSAVSILILDVRSPGTVPPLAFDKTSYEGYIQEGIVHHETITIPGYEGTQVDIGDTLYSVLFTASSSGGEVQVVPVGTLALPADVTFVTLELRVGSAVSILILDVRSPGTVPPLAFDKTSYEGYIQEGIVHHETITIPGYEGTQVDIGDTLYSVLFTASSSGGEVQVVPVGTLALPADVTFVTLELRVGSAVSILILDVRSPGTVPPLAFGKTSYEGYIQEGIVHHETITIPGYEGTQVDIGDTLYSVLFTASSSGGEVQVVPVGTLALPADVTFVTLELRVGSAVSILILDVRSPGTVPPLAFGKTSYEGYIQEGIVHHETITIPGYEGTQVDIGDTLYSVLFTASSSGGEVQVVPVGTLALPADVTFVTLELRVGSAVSILILDVRSPGTVPPLAFDKTSYEGYIQEGIVHHETITIPGYEGTQVDIGDTLYSVLFTASSSGGEVQVVPVGTLALPADVTFVTLELRVGSAVSILILDVRSPGTVPPLAFSKTSYEGYIQEGIVHHETITIPGYEGTQVDIGDTLYSVLFTASSSGGEVQVVPVGTLALPADVTFVTLELRVGSAVSILILDVRSPGTVPPLAFDKTSYEGYIQEGIVHHETITIPGYEGTQVDIGDTLYSVLFTASSSGGEVQVVPVGTLALPADVTFVTLELRVGSAVSILILDVRSPGTVPPLAFGKTSYEGYIQEGIVHHETITIPGYEGTQVDIGDTLYSVLFSASSSGGEVQVVPVDTLALPADVTFVTLELRVGSAVSILILDVRSPGVSFSASLYVMRVPIGHIGVVGHVEATADNGEDVTYSLRINDEHLQSRLSVTSDGEVRLSTSANNGEYDFEVVATTVFSKAENSAPVYFSVEAITTSDDSIVTPPLIVIDRDEEEAHRDLVVLNSSEQSSGCRYSLVNRWPEDQSWLYVDETGLHSHSIDREDPTIAFMSLSQVQVELTLTCESAPLPATRSSITRHDWLGPYDYGTYTWLLGTTIDYNPRKSVVNLIVNDINDNDPIFIGKENEPIAVGYPTSNLESTILPRSLIELQATDADVGENAALVYWSSYPQLVVSPTTGFVHINNKEELTHDLELIVKATDRNGAGRTGSITLSIKLLTSENIAILYVQNAFLEDESRILNNLRTVLGYEVKALRSSLVSGPINDVNDLSSRTKRQAVTNDGGTLEIYVYGLIQREPVEVEKLSTDINNHAGTMAIDIARIMSLQEHLDFKCDITTHGNGLLISTIILSIILFILIVAGVVWFFLKRKRVETYENFSDSNSMVSQPDALSTDVKIDGSSLPRLNLEELKKSERRLQSMLNAPFEEVSIEPSSAAINAETIIPFSEPISPIVIQDKLKDVDDSDDDEFGENKKARRKSVVTFNENVEKIIHVDENPDLVTDSQNEVYKL